MAKPAQLPPDPGPAMDRLREIAQRPDLKYSEAVAGVKHSGMVVSLRPHTGELHIANIKRQAPTTEPMPKSQREGVQAYFDKIKLEEARGISPIDISRRAWAEGMQSRGWVEVAPDEWRKKPEWVDAFFTEEGTINDDAFGNLLEHHVGAKVIQKNDGTFFNLSDEQKMHLRNAVRSEEHRMRNGGKASAATPRMPRYWGGRDR